MIVLDTSVLVDALTGAKRSGSPLRSLVLGRRIVLMPSLVLYEWLRGPRTAIELQDQETIFPSGAALPFDVEDAALSAKLYRSVRRARLREIDIAIAAITIRHRAELWTLNRPDFADIPGLRLFVP